MKATRTILDDILVDVRRGLAQVQRQRPLAELKRMIADAPAVRSFTQALRTGFGLVAEIKECSPSQGEMRRENVVEAPAAYEACPLVRCISVLTNTTHFGINIERLRAVKLGGTKPVLRKDFIYDEYQVYEARAFGADAVLLMANLLTANEMERLFALAQSLGMDALFECHDREQIESVPAGAVLYGVNSRSFAVRTEDYAAARTRRAAGNRRDLTTYFDRFEQLAKHLPPRAVKIAESGIRPENAAVLRDKLRYDALLVGTSLLTSPSGVHAELRRFEVALAGRS
jgi:indole-3-glycerol phosphate synthase